MNMPERARAVTGAVMVLLLLLFFPSFLLSADLDQKGQSVSASSSGQAAGALQFMGMVEPGKRMVIAILPGEYLKELLVQQGDRVKQGDIIARLSNDQLVSGLADLQQKRNTIQQTAQQSRLLKLEMAIKQKQQDEIDKELQKEKELSAKIQGYTSTISRELESQKEQLAGQISLLKARYEMAGESDRENEEMTKLLDEQIGEVRRRIEALTIRSPFDGLVSHVNEDPARIAPGGILGEIRDESFFMVRGAIIQHQYDLLKQGDKVSVSVDFIPGREVEGVVQAISQSWQKQQVQGYASFEVLIMVRESESLLHSGMVVSIEKKGQSSGAATQVIQ